MDGDSCVLIFVAIIFPPAAAAFIAGCGCDLIVNIFLTLLGYFPGLIHALWLIFQRIDAQERYGVGNYTHTGMGKYTPVTQTTYPRSTEYGTAGQTDAAPLVDRNDH